MLDMFQEDQLPASSTHKGAVRKGTRLTFSRYGTTLHTQVNGRSLDRIHSPKLCQAMFDLYIGEQPVSQRAKKQFADIVGEQMGHVRR